MSALTLLFYVLAVATTVAAGFAAARDRHGTSLLLLLGALTFFAGFIKTQL